MGPDDDRLPLWDAIRFLWHSVIHMSHAEEVRYEERTNAVRCYECGKTWGGTGDGV